MSIPLRIAVPGSKMLATWIVTSGRSAVSAAAPDGAAVSGAALWAGAAFSPHPAARARIIAEASSTLINFFIVTSCSLLVPNLCRCLFYPSGASCGTGIR